MHILLVNDDGIDAPGLAALESACRTLKKITELSVVAPSAQASQIGHQVTTDSPIPVDKQGDRRFAVSGTPADCTRLALEVLMTHPPDFVLSGINAGGNMGHDLVISGTVAAAREAAYHGVPAAAISHYMRSELELCWQTAARRTAALLDMLLDERLDDGEFFNVNLPHLDPDTAEPKLAETRPERAPLPVRFDTTPDGFHYSGRYAERPTTSQSSDVAVCFGGNISLTRLSVAAC